MPQELVPVHVRDMGALSPTPSLIFKREKGMVELEALLYCCLQLFTNLK